MQRCKLACGLCKGAKVGDKFRVVGGSPGWQVAGRELSECLLDLDGGGFGFRAFFVSEFIYVDFDVL